MWSNNYIGIPFKYKGRTKEGLDCWGLTRLIYQNEYNITLPSLSAEYEDSDVERIADLIAQYKEGWETTDSPSEGDVILFRVMGQVSHIGVAVSDTHFIHAREGYDSAIEAFSSPYWKRRIAGYFKYSQNKGVVLNTVPHPLKTQRYTVPIPAGTNLEQLANWMLKEYPVAEEIKNKVHITVNGKVVSKEKWLTTILKDTDVVEYRAVPTGGDTTRLLLTLAVIYVSIQFGPQAGSAMGFTEAAGYTAAQSAAYGTIAISLTGMALVNYIAPIRPPEMSAGGKDAGSSERQLMLNGVQNRTQPYAAIPVVLGKVRITPPLGAINYLSYESERDSYLSMLLTWGYGPLTIYPDSFKIGEKLLDTYTDYTLVTLDRKSTETLEDIYKFNAIYGNDITQVNSNLELTCDGNPEGVVTYDGEIIIGMDEFNEPIYGPSYITVFPPAGPWAEAISSEAVDSVTFALHFNQGLRKIKAKGEGAGDSFAAPTSFDFEYYFNGVWTSLGSVTLGSDSPKKDAFTYNHTFTVYADQIPLNEGLTVRVRRTTGDNVEDNPDYRYYHTSILQSVTFTRNAIPALDPVNCKIAKSAFKIKATDQLNGSIEGINAIAQTYCKAWNGVTWELASTSNPAALFRYVLEHPANSQRISQPATKFDFNQLQHWYNYCEAKGFEFNSVLGAQRSLLEVLRDICAAGRASPALIDGRWTVTIDEEKPNVIQHFTPHNSWDFEGVKALPKLPEGLRVTYFDEDQDYQESEIIVYAAGKNENNAELFEAIQLPGVTKKSAVIDHARWHMAQAKLRPEIYTLNADIEYLVCNRGDRVKVAHDVPMWGLGSGRIKNVLAANLYELDEQIPFEDIKNYTLRFRSAAGGSTVTTLVSSVDITYFAIANNVATITFDGSGHPFSVGDSLLTNVDIINDGAFTNLTITVTDITDNSISFQLVSADVANTAATGFARLRNGYYSVVKISDSLTLDDADAGDLFLYGELDTESQDLIVLGIEPTGNKSARLTLVDYGVTPQYNIFNDYLTMTADVVFESQITLPPRLLIDSLGNKVPTITRLTSDESVMEKISAGTFKYNLKVSYVNAEKLPSGVSFVQAQHDYDISTDGLNYKLSSVEYSNGSVLISDVSEGDVIKVRLRYVMADGRFGNWTDWQTTTVIGKTTPPITVSNFSIEPEYTTGKLRLTWESNPEIDIKGYEVRTQDANWGSPSNRIFLGDANTCSTFTEDSVHTTTYYVRAFDYSNNYSTVSASIVFEAPVPHTVTNLNYAYGTTSTTHSTVTFNWLAPTTQLFAIKEYKLTISRPDRPDEVLTTTANRYTTNADWLGNATLSVVTVDTVGSLSTPATLTIPKYAPNPATAFSTEVVDNNVLLRWTLPSTTSLPISHVLLKRGETWETADKVIGEKSGTFTSVFELAGGRYTYWLAVVDTDMRESTPVPVSVTVAQPPDFVFNAEWLSDFSGTRIFASHVTNSNSLLMLTEDADSWSDHYTEVPWLTPQDQIDAGYPIYAQPSVFGTSMYREVFNYGQVLSSSSITVSHIGTIIAGTPTHYFEIETSLDGTTWSAPQKAEAIFETNFQYIRVTLFVIASSDKDLYLVDKLTVRLDNKQVSDSGSVDALDTDTLGTIVNFNKEVIDVQSVIVTPAGTTPLTAVYDLKDSIIQATYSVVSNVCTVTAVAHGLETGQNVRLAVTAGAGINGVYTVTKVDADTYTINMIVADTTGSAVTYPQSMRLYVFNSTSGARQSAKVSWQIRGY